MAVLITFSKIRENNEGYSLKKIGELVNPVNPVRTPNKLDINRETMSNISSRRRIQDRDKTIQMNRIVSEEQDTDTCKTTLESYSFME